MQALHQQLFDEEGASMADRPAVLIIDNRNRSSKASCASSFPDRLNLVTVEIEVGESPRRQKGIASALTSARGFRLFGFPAKKKDWK